MLRIFILAFHGIRILEILVTWLLRSLETLLFSGSMDSTLYLHLVWLHLLDTCILSHLSSSSGWRHCASARLLILLLELVFLVKPVVILSEHLCLLVAVIPLHPLLEENVGLTVEAIHVVHRLLQLLCTLGVMSFLCFIYYNILMFAQKLDSTLNFENILRRKAQYLFYSEHLPVDLNVLRL